MSDSTDTVRLKNVSPFGDVDVPDIGRIIPAGDVLEVTDAQIVTNLTSSGHFARVDDAGTPMDAPQQADTAATTPDQAAATAQPATTSQTDAAEEPTK